MTKSALPTQDWTCLSQIHDPAEATCILRDRAALLSGLLAGAQRLAADRPSAMMRSGVTIHWIFFPQDGKISAAMSWRGCSMPPHEDRDTAPEEQARRRSLDAACDAMDARILTCLAQCPDMAASRAIIADLVPEVLSWTHFSTRTPDTPPVRSIYSSGFVRIGPFSAHQCRALQGNATTRPIDPKRSA